MTQKEQVKKHLNAGKRLTSWQAIEQLEARIARLENIVDELQNNKVAIVRKSRPNNLHLFQDSPFFDFDVFRIALIKKGWTEEEVVESYKSAQLYSEANNKKYANWISAIENWKRKEQKSMKINGNNKTIFEKRNTERVQLGSVADAILANRNQ